MARFRGVIGFVSNVETSPGVFTEVTTKRTYSGDVIRDAHAWENSGKVNDDIRLSNSFSIVADSFGTQNLEFMRFVEWEGVSWKITNVESRPPRLILTVGEKYNAQST